MKVPIKEKIEIPEGVEVSIEGHLIKFKGERGETQRKLVDPNLEIKKDGNFILIGCKRSTKKEKMMINTFRAHLRNLIKGVTEGFIYKMKICSSHFPMTVAVQGKEFIIKNYFGEKNPRKAKILEGVNVKIDGDEIVLEGCNIEAVGQTASNIEQITKRTKFDRRIFQDGIWLFHKAGKEL